MGALTVQLTFLLTIEKSNAATATVLQFLSPTIIVAWFAIARKARPDSGIDRYFYFTDRHFFVGHSWRSHFFIHFSRRAFLGNSLSVCRRVLYHLPFHAYRPLRDVTYCRLEYVIRWPDSSAFYARQGTHFMVNGSLILAFFYLVVIGTAVTFSLYLKGAQLIGGPKASILSCAEPLSSAFLSLLLLGITFTVPDWLGTLLILSSVILISIDSRRRIRKA